MSHDQHVLDGYKPWCGECIRERAAAEAEREREHDAEIDRLTCEFARYTEEAETAVGAALAAVEGLVSSRVYDIEMAEGSDGPDALRELGLAAYALRNAARIAKWRRDLLLSADPSMQAADQ